MMLNFETEKFVSHFRSASIDLFIRIGLATKPGV